MDSTEPRNFEVVTEDIEYLRHGGKPLLARLYRPKGAGPASALVEVHGGAWTSGDRLNNAVIATTLAAAGSVVLSLDFRMPPEAGYPASIADINLGIRFLKAPRVIGAAIPRGSAASPARRRTAAHARRP